MFLNNQPERRCKQDDIIVSSVTQIYIMACNNSPADNAAYIRLCIQYIVPRNKLHHIFEFRDNIMCPNRIDILMKYEYGLDYVHESPNDLNWICSKYRQESTYYKCSNTGVGYTEQEIIDSFEHKYIHFK